jgi:hypothetical protein
MNPKQIAIAAVMWTVAVGLSFYTVVSIRRGHMRVNRKTITREANPFAFWFWTIYFFLAAAFTFAVPVWKFSN